MIRNKLRVSFLFVLLFVKLWEERCRGVCSSTCLRRGTVEIGYCVPTRCNPLPTKKTKDTTLSNCWEFDEQGNSIQPPLCSPKYTYYIPKYLIPYALSCPFYYFSNMPFIQLYIYIYVSFPKFS